MTAPSKEQLLSYFQATLIFVDKLKLMELLHTLGYTFEEVTPELCLSALNNYGNQFGAKYAKMVAIAQTTNEYKAFMKAAKAESISKANDGSMTNADKVAAAESIIDSIGGYISSVTSIFNKNKDAQIAASQAIISENENKAATIQAENEKKTTLYKYLIIGAVVLVVLVAGIMLLKKFVIEK